jgi:hypothetical protein
MSSARRTLRSASDHRRAATAALLAGVLGALGAATLPAAAAPATAGAERVDRLHARAPGLEREVLRLALEATAAARERGQVRRPSLLTIIDYSLPSTAKRLWVLDLQREELLFHELVAHGKNTGENFASHFSNRPGSLQTSLGLFLTAGTYIGRNGYSLKLEGLERGVNDRAMARAIVIHGAPYVSASFARQHGRIGRSWGCPALPEEIAPRVIDTIKGGSLVFSYFPDRDWLASSAFLRGSRGVVTAAAR